MLKFSKIMLLTFSVVLVLATFLGVNTSGVRAASSDQDGAYHQIEVYSDVMQHIQSDYVTDPDIPAVTNGALRGLLESLDVDSSYLTADDYKAFKADKGTLAQVGINISKRLGYATVVSVVPGSPADKAGLVDGDIVEAIDGHDTGDLSLPMIRLMLEGAPGSTLTVGVIRSTSKPEPDKISMVRSTEALPPVAEAVYENASILYLKPQILDHDHVQQIETKLKAMQKAGNKKILLDLRDVAAGDMTDATLLANYLLKSGTIASLEGQKFPKQTFAADPSKAIQSTAPLVVLINHGTAGPAELVAAALLDNKRANLVGEHSFGEGTQQKLFELPDGAALILSVAKYESPDGKKIQDEGVTPDVVVASDSDKQATAGDDSLPATAPPPAAAVAASPTLKKLPEPQVDEQLNKALDLLKNKSA